MIYHIVDRTKWEKAQALSYYLPDTFEADGFIHASTKEQILPVANRFYAGQENLVILCIDENSLGESCVWESASHPDGSSTVQEGFEMLFPHIYGKLACDSVIEVLDFPLPANGAFVLPGALA